LRFCFAEFRAGAAFLRLGAAFLALGADFDFARVLGAALVAAFLGPAALVEAGAEDDVFLRFAADLAISAVA